MVKQHLTAMRWHYQSGFESALGCLYGVNLARHDQTDWLVEARSRGIRQRSRTLARKMLAEGKSRGMAKSYGSDPYTMIDKLFSGCDSVDHIGMALSG